MASNGKVAIITGAGSGIGKATALAFLSDGYCVTFSGRRQGVLEEAVKEANEKASKAIVVPTDVTDPNAVKNLFSKTRDTYGITGLTKSASLDGRKYDIACCQIDIGNAMTERSARILEGVPQADGSIKPEPMFNVRDVAKAVLYMASLPLDTNVQFMTIMATKMPFIGRG